MKHKIWKALRERNITFEGSHDIHTPQELVEEILSRIKLEGSILVLFNVEFVISLVYNYNIDPKKITFYSDHENKNKIADRLGVKIIESLDIDMKFDVVIGNPPFQSEIKGDGSAWPLFVKKSFELVKTEGIVSLVLPSVFGLPGPNIRKGKINVWKEYINQSSLKHLNLGQASSYFKNVGLSKDYFGYFITQSKNNKIKTKVQTNKDIFEIDSLDFDYLPVRGDRIDFSIEDSAL